MVKWQGHSLLLLHGWGFDYRVFNDLARLLGVMFKVSLPCLYRLAENTSDYSINAIAKRIANQIKQPTTLIGWSLGGLVATKVAALTQNIEKLVLLSYAPRFINTNTWKQTIDETDYMKLKKNFIERPDETMMHFLNLVCYGDDAFNATKRKLKQQVTTIKNQYILRQWLEELIIVNQIKTLCSLNIPKLFVYGEKDALIKSQSYYQFVSKMDNAAVIVLADCGHAPFVSNKEKINDIIERFMGVGID